MKISKRIKEKRSITVEIEIDIEYLPERFFKGNLHGQPEDCYPDEVEEAEILDLKISVDTGNNHLANRLESAIEDIIGEEEIMENLGELT